MKVALCMVGLGLVTLIAFLVLRRFADRMAAGRRSWPGTGFDASSLRPRLNAVRADYLAELRARPRDSGHHRELLARAHRAVLELNFFQARRRTGSTAGEHSEVT